VADASFLSDHSMKTKHSSNIEEVEMANWKQELLALEKEYATMSRDDGDSVKIENELCKKRFELGEHYSSNRAKRLSAEEEKRKSKQVRPMWHFPKQPEPPARVPIIPRRSAKFLERVAAVLYNHYKQEANERQAADIKVVDQAEFVVIPGSTEHFIQQALLANSHGLHINEIIEAIEAAGWVSESKYHRYSAVNKALRQHYYMFASIRDGKTRRYKLRLAFRSDYKPKKIGVSLREKRQGANIPTLKDIVADIIRQCKKQLIYPSKIVSILQGMGYRDVSYKSVHAAMQDETIFRREGFAYGLQTKG
jgi:hypothetical protein